MFEDRPQFISIEYPFTDEQLKRKKKKKECNVDNNVMCNVVM